MSEVKTQLQIVSLQIEVVSLREENARLLKGLLVEQAQKLQAASDAEDKAEAESKIAGSIGVPADKVQIEGIVTED